MRSFFVIQNRNSGFFSCFFATLQYVHLGEIRNRIPIVNWDLPSLYRNTKPYMGEKTNIWQYYFHPISKYRIEDIEKDDDVKYVKKYRRTNPSTPPYTWDYQSRPPNKNMFYPSKESRVFVNNIINKYIVLRDYLVKDINDYFDKYMKGFVSIGVHIRPTAYSYGTIKYKDYFKYIDEIIKKNNKVNLYLGTDNFKTIEIFKKKYGSILLYNDFERIFNSDKPANSRIRIHLVESSSKEKGVWGAEKAREAIVDCLLLSKCNYLISGSSNLSTAVTYFNPELEHIFLYNGKRYY